MITVKQLCDKGIIPLQYDFQQAEKEGKTLSITEIQPLFMGQCVGLVDEVKPAGAIVEELVRDAIAAIERNKSTVIYSKSKL